MAGIILHHELEHGSATAGQIHNNSTNIQTSSSLTLVKPMFHRKYYTTHTFHDFVTPDLNSIIHIMGPWQALDALERTLTSTGDIHALRYDETPKLSPWLPFLISLNTVCTQIGLPIMTEDDLQQFLCTPWFLDFAKHSVKHNKLENKLDLGKLASTSAVTEDHMSVVLEAFAACHSIDKIELGIVHLCKNGIEAQLYPWTANGDKHTVWIVVNDLCKPIVFYGLGRRNFSKQIAAVDQSSDDDDSDHEDSDDEDSAQEEEEDEENTDAHLPEVSTTTLSNFITKPRETASRIVAQRTPLNAGLTVDTILQNHIDRLHYNNVLKVGLNYSNAQIAKKVNEADAAVKKSTKESTKNSRFETGASGVVKRINTAIKYIEDQLNIKSGAFRTEYDRTRKANGVPIRGKDEVSEADLATFATQIRGAMEWIEAGGPRPLTLVPYGTAGLTGSASTSTAPSTTAAIAPVPHIFNQYPAPVSQTVAPTSNSWIPAGYDPASSVPIGRGPPPDASPQ
ncbi:hypothetical protein E4T38_02950 [Aureobasidium subglaciale]|nr:hypothetical protein E4T38_02950 [Aureobasidium subglaciale]KAI5227337.1 hypothetical protein E4T40_02613 [Aureobasidium subglaciale]KAI5230489.1 hypothetical protein E4T41_02949 [Aureobasidium subglaciale]KAI5265010.1 hypothetical protein E4T46_02727 [Aureobasidium subglaciale]